MSMVSSAPPICIFRLCVYTLEPHQGVRVLESAACVPYSNQELVTCNWEPNHPISIGASGILCQLIQWFEGSPASDTPRPTGLFSVTGRDFHLNNPPVVRLCNKQNHVCPGYQRELWCWQQPNPRENCCHPKSGLSPCQISRGRYVDL